MDPDLDPWLFYGRSNELLRLLDVLERRRFFFARVTGRRRIGKTALIQRALARATPRESLYLQIPDSAPAGVLSAFADALDTFGFAPARTPRPTSMRVLAATLGRLAREGVIIVLDEFQYFSRRSLFEFTSHLQAVVDELAADAANVPGGLVVLGSVHTDLIALLEDRAAPLYSRTTDELELDHLDIASVLAILRAHADPTPERLLFLWNLFEGVPKFYRDAFEQRVLSAERKALLRRLFFESSSPLRTEADHWFLHELRGRYDVILKFVARNPGCGNGEIEGHVRALSPETAEQTSSYMKVLLERYRILERRLPVLSRPKARRHRYYVRDNFLRSWLSALASPVSAIKFRPIDVLLEQADERLMEVEGHALERLTARLYEERSRKGLGFPLTSAIQGYWDRGDVELDLIASNDEERVLRLGTCKRRPDRLLSEIGRFEANAQAFLASEPRFEGWKVEMVAIAPRLEEGARKALAARGIIAEDLLDLTRGL